MRFGGSKRMEPDRGHSRQESSHAMEFTPLPGTLILLSSLTSEFFPEVRVMDEVLGVVPFFVITPLSVVPF